MIEHTYEFIKSMNSEFKFYTYCHIRKDTNAVFYVGKGCDRRAWSKSGRNTYWQRVVDKAGYYVQIISFHATEELAFKYEEFSIGSFPTKLTNMTDGGEGISGYVLTDEHKNAIRESKLGKNNPFHASKGIDNPFKGKSHTIKSKKLMSETKTGIPLTDEHKEKLREYALSGNHPTFNKSGLDNHMYGRTAELNPAYKGIIIATNIKTGVEIILTGYSSIKEHGFQPGHVYSICNGAYGRKSCKGFTFKRIDNQQ